MARTKYTPDQRQRALAVLAEHGPGTTVRQLGTPSRPLSTGRRSRDPFPGPGSVRPAETAGRGRRRRLP
jgi:hypothetical protein